MSEKKGAISGVFVFLLLGVFALLGTVLVLLGAWAYRGTAERGSVHNDTRIATAYLRSMVRGADSRDAVAVESLEGTDVIALTAAGEEESLVTRLYVREGKLMENLTLAEDAFDPELGTEVCPAGALEASLEDGLLRARILTEDGWQQVSIALYAAGERGEGR